MTAYTIVSTRTPRGFVVKDSAGHVLAELRQPKLFSQHMEGTLDGRVVVLASEGFWRMRYGVFLDGARIGIVKTTGWGHLKWDLCLPGKPPVELEFISLTWRYRYHVRVAKDLILLELKPVFRWATFSTDYDVEVKGAGIAPEQMPLMLALAGFSARLKKAQAHAAAGV